MIKNFNFDDLKFRKIQNTDFDDVKDIAKRIWDDDYIPRFFNDWINDKGRFYGVEYKGRIIGFGKITFHPGKSCWLEGLRLHPKYQKIGIGRAFNKFLYSKVFELVQKGGIEHVEFSTYYKNAESLLMAEKNGFKIVKRFYVLYRRKRKKIETAELITDWKWDKKIYGEYIPFGWKFIRNTKDADSFIRAKGSFYNKNGTLFYRYGEEKTFCFTVEDCKLIISLIPAMNGITDKGIEIMIPENWGYMLPELKKHGFRFWDFPETPNVVVLRKM